jgi:hypothetical protein
LVMRLICGVDLSAAINTACSTNDAMGYPPPCLPADRYLQKSLNRSGDSSVYFTVCWMFRWPR